VFGCACAGRGVAMPCHASGRLVLLLPGGRLPCGYVVALGVASTLARLPSFLLSLTPHFPQKFEYPESGVQGTRFQIPNCYRPKTLQSFELPGRNSNFGFYPAPLISTAPIIFKASNKLSATAFCPFHSACHFFWSSVNSRALGGSLPSLISMT
jgi:hypothetical protein